MHNAIPFSMHISGNAMPRLVINLRHISNAHVHARLMSHFHAHCMTRLAITLWHTRFTCWTPNLNQIGTMHMFYSDRAPSIYQCACCHYGAQLTCRRTAVHLIWSSWQSMGLSPSLPTSCIQFRRVCVAQRRDGSDCALKYEQCEVCAETGIVHS